MIATIHDVSAQVVTRTHTGCVIVSVMSVDRRIDDVHEHNVDRSRRKVSVRVASARCRCVLRVETNHFWFIQEVEYEKNRVSRTQS